MKKHFLLLAAFICLLSWGAAAQTCLPDGITFSTQGQIDAFSTNYPGCTEILGDVTIQESIDLNITDLSGLSQLTSIGEDLRIIYDDALTSLRGLDNLNSIGGGLSIYGNYALISLTGLGNLTSIGGQLEIYVNASLTSLTGLDNVTSIGGHLSISSNDALTSLTGLDNVTSVGGVLSISGNASLTSLTGLGNIDHTTITDLHIVSSGLLSTCDVQSICDYLANPDNLASISGNATGCATRAEVEAACLEVPVSEVENGEVAIFPNPTKGVLEITGPGMELGAFTVTDAIGRVVKRGTAQSRRIDISELAKGMYFVTVHSDDRRLVGRVVKE